MKLYLAGPMTGIPQYNIPAFDEAAFILRALQLGYDVVSPAELDDPETRAAALASPDGAPGSGSANGETWGDFLARDVKLLADGGIDGVVVLPGWEKSRGARLETFVASRMMGLPIYRYDVAWLPHMDRVPMVELLDAWAGDTGDEMVLINRVVSVRP